MSALSSSCGAPAPPAAARGRAHAQRATRPGHAAQPRHASSTNAEPCCARSGAELGRPRRCLHGRQTATAALPLQLPFIASLPNDVPAALASHAVVVPSDGLLRSLADQATCAPDCAPVAPATHAVAEVFTLASEVGVAREGPPEWTLDQIAGLAFGVRVRPFSLCALGPRG